MAIFTPKIEEEIIPDMTSTVLAGTPITDLVPGSVILTILEAAASEDAEQYMQAFNIVRSFSLDTTEGTDLDNRASEYGLTRNVAVAASGGVTFGDTAFSKISTDINNNFSGPVAGQTFVYADKTTSFAASGSIIVGRTTSNAETVNYSSVINSDPFSTKFILSTAFTNDHGTDETIIYSQGGNRVIGAGTIVKIPESDVSDEITFTLDAIATILDGDSEVTTTVSPAISVNVSASAVGAAGNAPANTIIEFDTLPFATATVNNGSTYTNGSDKETDQELRDRIKNTILSLSRGTQKSIELAVIGAIDSDTNKRVVSSNLIEATQPAAISTLYIDDGTGFTPTELGSGLEVVLLSATGGEQFLSLDNIPLRQEVYISNRENTIDIIEAAAGSVEVHADLTVGVYTITELLAHIKSALEEASSLSNAIILAEQIRTQMNLHAADAGAHTTLPDNVNFPLTSAPATDLGTLVTLVSETLADYDVHDDDAELGAAWVYHAGQEAADWSPSNVAAPGTLAECIDRLNDLKIKFNGHDNDGPNPPGPGAHGIVGTYPITESSDAETYTVTVDIYNKITIAASANFQLLWSTGDNGTDAAGNYRNAGELLGFAVSANSVSANSHTATYQPRIVMLFKNKGGLTGTPTMTTGNTAVTGLTADEVSAGDYIKLVDDPPTAWAKVIATPTATTATLRWVYEGVTGAAAAEVMTILQPANYTLNRFIGEIELVTSLVSGDKIEAGETTHRGRVVSGNAETYDLTTVAATSHNATFTQGSTAVTFVVAPTNVDAGDYIILDADFTVPGITALAGNTTFTTGSTAVSSDGGGGVDFTADLAIGNFIKLDADADTKFARIASITDATNLVLAEGYTGVGGVGASSIADPWARVASISGVNAVLDWVYAGAGGGPGAGRVCTPDTLLLLVDDKPVQTATFKPFDFLTVASLGEVAVTVATAQEVVDRLNEDIFGIIADNIPGAANDLVEIITTTDGSIGTIQISGGSANTALAFSTTEVAGIDGYKYYTGLIQTAQFKVDGNSDSGDEQVRAAGVQVEVAAPTVSLQTVEVDITTEEGVTLVSVTSSVKSAISNYINSLGIGKDVILSEIIDRIQNISGVFDISVTLPTSNVAIADGGLARVVDASITVT